MASKVRSELSVSPSYAMAAAADTVPNHGVGSLKRPKTIEEIALDKTIKGLTPEPIDLEAIRGASSKLLSSRLSSTLSREGKVRPHLTFQERYVILPVTFKEEDHYIGQYMMGISKELGLTVFLINYEGKSREISNEMEKISQGIFISLEDFSRKIRVKSSNKDFVEIGRTIVRAQQTIKIFSAKELGQRSLLPNHEFFGNNPGEQMVINKKEVPMVYNAKNLGFIFPEEEWAEQLRIILISLIRESARFLAADVVTHLIESSLLTKEDTIAKYCSSYSTFQKGKKKWKERRIPKKPRASPLLKPLEASFIETLVRGIFSDPLDIKTSWAEFVTTFGFDPVMDRLKSNYHQRQSTLEGFARVTTARLKEYRKIRPEERYKKKKDIQQQDVEFLIRLREDPLRAFAREVLFLDTDFSGCLSLYKSVDKQSGRLDPQGSILKLIEDIKSFGVYDENKLSSEGFVEIKAPGVLQPLEPIEKDRPEVSKRKSVVKTITPEMIKQATLSSSIKREREAKQKEIDNQLETGSITSLKTEQAQVQPEVYLCHEGTRYVKQSPTSLVKLNIPYTSSAWMDNINFLLNPQNDYILKVWLDINPSKDGIFTADNCRKLDSFLKERTRAFYSGLVPQTEGSNFSKFSNSVFSKVEKEANMEREEDYIKSILCSWIRDIIQVYNLDQVSMIPAKWGADALPKAGSRASPPTLG